MLSDDNKDYWTDDSEHINQPKQCEAFKCAT